MTFNSTTQKVRSATMVERVIEETRSCFLVRVCPNSSEYSHYSISAKLHT